MKFRFAALSAIVCLSFNLPALAQTPMGFVTVTGQYLAYGTSPGLVSSATISFQPVDNSGNKISFRAGGPGGQRISQPVTAQVSSGAFSVILADTMLTAPQNICYSVTVTDNVTGRSLLGPGYTCVQPAGSGTAVTAGDAWCTAAGGGHGGACNFDEYTPNLSPGVITQTGPQGPAGPQGASAIAGMTGDGLGNAALTGIFKAGGIQDLGGQLFNVKGYGAKGDGATDDSVAIGNAIGAINAAGGGILFFPFGVYYTATCNFSITSPTVIQGVGQLAVDSTESGSLIKCGSTTANLFNVTADLVAFRDIAATNPSTPTAGAAIYMNGGTIHSRINAEDFSINGFYDAIDVNAAAYWDISRFHITNPVRYGISVNNVLNNDEGDWQIHDGSCVGGAQTNTSTTAGSSACISIFTSGGGKISTIKSNATFTHGIYMNVASSGQTLITHVDIENVTNSPIYIAQGWPFISITNSYLLAPGTYPAIYANGLNGFYIGGNLLESPISGSNPYAIVVTGSQLGLVGPNQVNNHFSATASLTCTSACFDMSGITTSNPLFHGLTSDQTTFFKDFWFTQTGAGIGTTTSGSRIFDDGSLHLDAAPNSHSIILSGNAGGEIVHFRTTAAGSDVAAIDTSGNFYAGAGTNTVYRCATAGTLPAGALTITAANCGTTTDTGLRVK